MPLPRDCVYLKNSRTLSLTRVFCNADTVRELLGQMVWTVPENRPEFLGILFLQTHLARLAHYVSILQWVTTQSNGKHRCMSVSRQ